MACPSRRPHGPLASAWPQKYPTTAAAAKTIFLAAFFVMLTCSGVSVMAQNGNNICGDVVFVVDSSSSISTADFASIKQFLTTQVGFFQPALQTGDARLAVITFTNSALVQIPLVPQPSNYTAAVQNLRRLDGATRIVSGLTIATGLLQATPPLASSAVRQVVLLSDGATFENMNRLNNAAQELRSIATTVRTRTGKGVRETLR